MSRWNRYYPLADSAGGIELSQATIDTDRIPDARVRELEDQLRRERSARVGVERGLQALSERLTQLQHENRELRERLGRP